MNLEDSSAAGPAYTRGIKKDKKDMGDLTSVLLSVAGATMASSPREGRLSTSDTLWEGRELEERRRERGILGKRGDLYTPSLSVGSIAKRKDS